MRQNKNIEDTRAKFYSERWKFCSESCKYEMEESWNEYCSIKLATWVLTHSFTYLCIDTDRCRN